MALADQAPSDHFEHPALSPVTSNGQADPPLVLPHPLPQGYVEQILEAAKRMHDAGYWVIPIRARGENYPKYINNKSTPAVAKGKEPFKIKWGRARWPWSDVAKEIRAIPGRGYGLVLGPGKAPGDKWLIDAEGDGIEAETSWLTLCGGENVQTSGWTSRRGTHRLATGDGERLLDLLVKSGAEGKTGQSGVFHHPSLPGLELRIGGVNQKGEQKQVQSVGAPCLGEDGEPRIWLPCSDLAELPGSAYSFLERLAREKYGAKALASEAAIVAAQGQGDRHAALLSASCRLASLCKAGSITEDQALKQLTESAEANGLVAEGRGEEVIELWESALPRVDARQFPILSPPSSNGKHKATGNGRLQAIPQAGFACTDMGNAERLVARHGSKLRYCHPWKKWLVYDGRRWAEDATAVVERLAKETVRSIYLEVSLADDLELRKALAAHAVKSEKRERISAMMALAQSEPGVAVLPDQLDTDGGVFNFNNGTLELRTGVLRSHRKDDLISKLCGVDFDPDAKCPNYDATLDLFLGGAADLIGYVDRISGCAMHGAVRDHILPIAYGTGSNGKSTILGAWLDAFGNDYAMKAPISLLIAKKGDCHPTERMDLYRKRLVVAIETADGARLNEVMVKELTGGDRIRGRRLYEDDWEFSPTHTIVMATNHRPDVKGTDKGIWRRLKEVPFTVSVDTDKADLDMPEKLRAERAGIMARCARGCRDYFASGLREPQAVTEATAEYRSEQDQIGRFMDEHINRVAGARARCGDVYSRYGAWAEACGETALTLTSFGKRVAEMGIEKTKSKPKWYLGIDLCSGESDDKAC